jgi:hypothetical protein
MKLGKAAILCGLGVGLVGVGAYGGATLTGSHVNSVLMAAEEKTPAHSALEDLRLAQKHLEETDKDLNGHRKAAADHVKDAIDQLEQGLGMRPDSNKKR